MDGLRSVALVGGDHGTSGDLLVGVRWVHNEVGRVVGHGEGGLWSFCVSSDDRTCRLGSWGLWVCTHKSISRAELAAPAGGDGVGLQVQSWSA